jgi:glutathione S-transferase
MSTTPILLYEAGACSFGSIVAADWAGQPFQVAQAAGDVLKSPAYTRLNPRAQVPALVLGDRVLTESLAILYHLAAHAIPSPAAAERVFPRGSPDQDRLDQVMSFLVSSLHASWVPVFHPDRYADAPEAQASVKEHALAIAHKKLREIERSFLRDDGLFFPRPTVADAYFFGLVRWGTERFDMSGLPRTRRFIDRMNDEPSVQFALSVEAGHDRGARGRFEGRIDIAQLFARSADG